MAGLLDAFNDPGFQRGLLMMAASRPMSEQQRAGLLSYIDNQEQYKQQRELMGLKMEGERTSLAAKNMEIEAAKRAQEQRERAMSMLGGWMGGTPNAPAGDVARLGMESAPGFAGPVSPQAQATAQAPARTLADMPYETALQIEMLGGPKLRDYVKDAKQGTKFDPGAMYRMADGSMFMAPKLGEGQMFDGQRVMPVPGAAQANADYIGAQTAAQEWAKVNPQSALKMREAGIAAQHDLVNGVDASGNPVAMSRAGALSGLGGFRPSPTADQRAAQDAQRESAVAQAKADVAPQTERLSRYDSASNAIALIDRAIVHPGLESATGLSGVMDPRNHIPGTDAKNFQVMLDQIKGGAFMTAFQTLKGGGQITEKEGEKAQAAIARMDRAQSTEEFVRGLTDYRSVLAAGLERAGKPPGSESRQPTTSSKMFDELPKTGVKPGARVRDTATGKILTFDGMQWK